ncbi:MAG TPA: rhodanese-like domain-containing protein [Marmoricola sp.]|jgi:rhodanese-related sulfurtransferase
MTRHVSRTAVARVTAAFVAAGALALAATSCGSDNEAAPPAPPASSSGAPAASSAVPGTAPLDVASFAAAIAQGGTVLVDVRTPEEYAAGHLAGAVNLDVQGPGFADAVAALDPSGHYAVYCHSGNRSAVAVAYLREHGFASVAELSGGIVAWQAAGRPVTTG